MVSSLRLKYIVRTVSTYVDTISETHGDRIVDKLKSSNATISGNTLKNVRNFIIKSDVCIINILIQLILNHKLESLVTYVPTYIRQILRQVSIAYTLMNPILIIEYVDDICL